MANNKVGMGRLSQAMKGTPMVKNSAKGNVKSNSPLSKLSATSKGKAISKGKAKMASIKGNKALAPMTVQKLSAKAPIKTMKLARKFSGKPTPKKGSALKMAVTRMANKKAGKIS